MPFCFLSTLGVAFILLLAVSTPDVHAGHPARRSVNLYQPGLELIMERELLFVNGPVPVYLPNGQVAFMVTRQITDPLQGNSEYVVSQAGTGQTLLVLDSVSPAKSIKSQHKIL